MGVAYRILASAGASASASGQAGLGVQPQTTPPPLTTIFTPPPQCKTPFVFEADCHSAYGCDGYYLPVLRVGDLNGPPIKCYPETTTLSDGVVDAIYDYKPGLFCPDGMTTATRIGTVFLCCPTGLTYTYDGRYDFCSATWTEWTGYAGSWKDLEGAISKTVVYSAADHMRLNVAAPVIWLSGQDPDANPGNGLGSPSRLSPSTPPGSGPPTTVDSNTTETSTLLKASSNLPNNNNNNNGDGNTNNNDNNGGDGNVNNNNNKNCRRDDCQITTTALSGTREEPPSPTKQSEQSDLNRSGAGDSVPLGSVGAQVGLGVGGAFVLILLTLGFILIRRYRRKRLLKRAQGLNSPSTESDGSGAEVARQLGGYPRKYVPELPVVESRVELEGTLADDRGAGIYVWKPELEGTTGARGARDVYVKKKSELEARRSAAADSGQRARVRPAPGSPTDESSFTRPRDPPPTPNTIQMYI